MTATLKLINLCLLCGLTLCDGQSLNVFNVTSSSVEISNSVTLESTEVNEDDQWSTAMPSRNRTVDERPQPCFSYYEYCTNRNATYKFQTNLRGKKLPTSGYEKLAIEKIRCFCDPGCHLYGDCCYDQLAIDNTTGEPIKLYDSEIKWECRRTPIKIRKHPTKDIVLMLVTSCPSDFDDVDVIRLCERDNVPSSQYHYSIDMPALSLTTKRTYVNIYCAMCNNDTDVHKWNITFYCSDNVSNCLQNRQSWNYVRGENRWTIAQNDSLYNITYDLFIQTQSKSYYEMFRARRCRPDFIRDCPADWSDNKTRALCATYSLSVRSNTNRQIYKNEHCAVCNGQIQSSRNLVCPVASEIIPEAGNTGGVHPYALLVDFYGDGGVGETRNCGDKQCKFGEICDPIFVECRIITCGRLFYLNSDGECVRNVDTDVDFNSPYLNDSCPKFYVHQPDYAVLPNNSIYVNSTLKIYVFNEHEVINETTVIICADGFYNFGKFNDAQSILSMIGVVISLLCLAVHIFIHIFLNQLRNLHGINVLSLSCCLFVSQLFFQFGLQLQTTFAGCVAIGMTIHFGFLASFFWMNIMAIDICRTFATKSYRPSNDDVWREYRKYSLYAWLLPLIIVLLAMSNDLLSYLPNIQPNYAKKLCWINNRDALLVYFAGPLGILLLENIVLFLLTVVGIYEVAKVSKIARQSSTANGQGIADDRTRLILYAKLAIIMGLTWVFGFIAALSNATVLWYMFIIFNSLQGAFIFIAFSCKRSTFHQVRVKFFQLIGRKRNVAGDRTLSNRTQLSALTSGVSTSLQNLNCTKNWPNQ